MEIARQTRRDIETELEIATRALHYYVEKGGAFLKDAAVLAGLGCIGRNNLLVTPSLGPRVRLRALLLETDLEPGGPLDFNPCATCEVDCRAACPAQAMDGPAPACMAVSDITTLLPARDGTYDRDTCNTRMELDEAAARRTADAQPPIIRYCRTCELVCPVGLP
ncbi:MAG: hypothetical protein JW781_05900 [Deltaproteobacteria bacterium]|nr:hypothetical protein [Candidatus Anaeroferrophillacea bacterium]